ncbi:Low affinity potassium transport system protein kup [Heracleum sosnowskyi]|uniref:Low affinity potassium transport system protein kup n=1 Tax=Heracleum sosnowskyi TaxID=360622 RepID=A0AAD8HQ77_9APIA|nr:Low affinity potassium transport system protein kup [Heracleum sosnowskyi]
MLLAVEGGGFFSASATGYSKGLALLLLGQKTEEKPMRVTPWSHYQLVDQKSEPDLQLASSKNRLVRGCASFVCFGHTASGPEGPSPLKVGPTQQCDVLPEPAVFDKENDDSKNTDPVDSDVVTKQNDLKSSLKKSTTILPVSSRVSFEIDGASEKSSSYTDYIERRKVQWMDVSGGELVEVREFETSDDGSDNEFDNVSERACSCSIM